MSRMRSVTEGVGDPSQPTEAVPGAAPGCRLIHCEETVGFEPTGPKPAGFRDRSLNPLVPRLRGEAGRSYLQGGERLAGDASDSGTCFEEGTGLEPVRVLPLPGFRPGAMATRRTLRRGAGGIRTRGTEALHASNVVRSSALPPLQSGQGGSRTLTSEDTSS